MGYNLSRKSDDLGKKHRNRRFWRKIVGFLACVVVFCTTYALILPALTLEATPYCGIEEHQHTEDCYTQNLICGKEESTLPLHTHTEDCYTDVQTLICGQDETTAAAETTDAFSDGENAAHTHTETCYDADGNLTCGQEETAAQETGEEAETGHTHTEDCYSFEQVLSCGQEENTVEPHEHTADCYEDVLICGKEEHTHSLACYSDSTADTEEAGQWEATLPQSLDGARAERLIAVAKSQTGYQESTKNYETTDGVTKKGYTRYGAWYGETYGDWTAMFVSFCLNYAEIPQNVVPYGSDCSAWIADLQTAGLYAAAGTYTPQAGDILFLTQDLAAVITKVNTDADDNPTTLDLIMGDSNDAVESRTLDADSESILGYAMLPADPSENTTTTTEAAAADQDSDEFGDTAASETESTTEAVDMIAATSIETTGEETSEATEAQTESTTETNGTTETTTGTTTAAELITETTTETTETTETPSDEAAEENGIAIISDELEYFSVDLANDDTTVGDLSGKLTSEEITGTSYDGTQKEFKSTVLLGFTLKKSDIVTNNTYTWDYVLPEGLLPVDSLISEGNKKFYDKDGTEAGTYKFTKDSDGKYHCTLTLDETYVENAGDEISGTISFSAEIGEEEFGENGEITVRFTDEATIIVKAEDITWPSNKTVHYDLTTQKQSAGVNGEELSYRVNIDSTKGTPDPLELTDTLTASSDSLTISELKNVTLQKRAGDWNWTAVTLTQVSSEEALATTENSYYVDLTNKVVKYNLKALGSNDEHYQLTYTYACTGVESGTSVTVDNTITAYGENKTTGEIVKYESKTESRITKTMTVEKRGSYNSETSTIDWVITLNANKQSLAGYVLEDAMFGQIGKNDLDITSSSGTTNYTVTESDGKVSKITFGETSDTYTIKYSTSVTPSWDAQTITNTGTLSDGAGGTKNFSGSATVSGGSMQKTIDSAKVSDDEKTSDVTWTVTLNLTDGGIPANTVLTDTFSGSAQYMTWSQIKNWNGVIIQYASDGTTSKEQLNSSLYSVTFVGSNNNTYALSDIISAESDTNLTYTDMKISFANGVSKAEGVSMLKFTYTTTADLQSTEIGAKYYTNKVEMGKNDASATYTYYKEGVQKLDGNGRSANTTTENADGTLTWQVKVAVNSDKYTYLTLNDTLPEGVELTALSLTNVSGGHYYGLTYDSTTGVISGSNSEVSFTGSYGFDTRALTVRIDPLTTGTYLPAGTMRFNLTCKISEISSKDTLTVTNSVTVNSDQGTFGNSSQTQTWKKYVENVTDDVLNKTSIVNKDSQRLTYQVILNPQGLNLDTTSDTVTLTDTLTYSGHPNKDQWLDMELQQDTVKLYEAKYDSENQLVLGEEVTEWSWVLESSSNVQKEDVGDGEKEIKYTEIITAVVPDEKMLVLTYDYAVDFELSDYPNAGNEVTWITNKAYVEGQTAVEDDSHSGKEWEKSESSVVVWTGKTYTFVKVDNNNYGKALEGAEFTLYEYSAAEGGWISAGKIFQTGTDGKVEIHWQRSSELDQAGEDYQYKKNTAYYLVETKSPDGYIMPENPDKYYFYFSDSDTITNVESYPSDFDATAYLDLSSEGGLKYVTNTERNSYTLKKVNADDGTEGLSGAEFTLYKYVNSAFEAATKTVKGEDGTETTQNVIFTTDSNGEIQIQWQETKSDYQFSEDVLYRLVETKAPDGYVLPDNPEAKACYFCFRGSATSVSGTWTESSGVLKYDSSVVVDLSSGNASQTITNKARKTYKLLKVDSEELTEKLKGAIFTLYKYDSSSKSFVEATYIPDGEIGTVTKTFTTDGNGSIEIGWQDYPFEENVVYYVKETTAPSGYVLPDSPNIYMFSFGSPDEAGGLYSLPTGKSSADIVNLNENEGNVTVENTSIPETSITVNKKWLSESGTDITSSKDGSVNIQLYYLTSKNPFEGSSSGDETNTVTVTFNFYCNNNIAFEKSVETKEGDKITFTISNTSSNTVCHSDWSNTITGEKISGNSYKFEYTVGSADVTLVHYCYEDIDGAFEVKILNDSEDDKNVSSSGVGTGGEEYDGGVYSISSSSSWTITIDDLPEYYVDDSGEKIYYGYYVVETSSNYASTAKYENDTGIASGTITITNTEPDSSDYSLPETGGTGTLWYTLGGWLLVLASAGSLMYKQRQNRKEGR